MSRSIYFSVFCCAAIACGGGADAPQRPEDAKRDAPESSVSNEPALSPACAPPLADLRCETEKPAPTASTEVTRFLKEGAIPLRCGEGSSLAWDVRPLVDLFGERAVFMLGEVHGSNEIGIFSAVMLEALAERSIVDVVAYELPMDVERALQSYVDGVDDPVARSVLGYFEENAFPVTLTETSRALASKGIPLRVGAVDIPSRPQIAATAIREIATKLTTHESVVLGTLPRSFSAPTTPAERAQVDAYHTKLSAKLSEVCEELSEDDCDRLSAMNHALWASAFQGHEFSDVYVTRREEVIYFNLRRLMTSPTNRMYLHMGSAHTDKHSFSAGSRMDKEFALTKGRVFSVAPAWGNGSRIAVGDGKPLVAEPTTLGAALADQPAHPLFISTTRPSPACEANPLRDVRSTQGRGRLAQSYDGFIHYGRLTSESRPQDSSLPRRAR